VNVNWNPDITNSEVTVHCTDGSQYIADHIIFTPSVGVLKARHQTLFTPNLPAHKIKAIESVGYGAIGKIFFEFDKPFWPTGKDEWVCYSLLWSASDLKAVHGTDREW